MTVVKSLSKIAKIYNVKNIGENDTTDEIIDKIAGGMVFGSSNVTVAGATPSTQFAIHIVIVVDDIDIIYLVPENSIAILLI